MVQSSPRPCPRQVPPQPARRRLPFTNSLQTPARITKDPITKMARRRKPSCRKPRPRQSSLQSRHLTRTSFCRNRFVQVLSPLARMRPRKQHREQLPRLTKRFPIVRMRLATRWRLTFHQPRLPRRSQAKRQDEQLLYLHRRRRERAYDRRNAPLLGFHLVPCDSNRSTRLSAQHHAPPSRTETPPNVMPTTNLPRLHPLPNHPHPGPSHAKTEPRVKCPQCSLESLRGERTTNASSLAKRTRCTHSTTTTPLSSSKTLPALPTGCNRSRRSCSMPTRLSAPLMLI